MISERITKINKSLSPVTTILRLSADSSVIDQHLFDSMTHDDLVKLAVNMVTQLNDVKVLLKDCRTVLEDIDVTAPLHPAPQISTQISDLQSALNDLKISKPEPLDYSKLISGLEKPVKDAFKKLPIQKPVVNTKKQAREVAEFQARSCNVMVYNCLRCSVNDSALDVARKSVGNWCQNSEKGLPQIQGRSGLLDLVKLKLWEILSSTIDKHFVFWPILWSLSGDTLFNFCSFYFTPLSFSAVGTFSQAKYC